MTDGEGVNQPNPGETAESPAFSDVLAELLRPPYVVWLMVAMVVQVYTAWYLTPVAALIVAVTSVQARQAVRRRLRVCAAPRSQHRSHSPSSPPR